MPASFDSYPSPFGKPLIVGEEDDVLTRSVILVGGRVYSRGEVLGKITASGKYVLSTSAASDGSQVTDVVLTETVDATAGDTPALVYVRGTFAESSLVLGTGHTLASIRETLRGKGIFTDTIQGI